MNLSDNNDMSKLEAGTQAGSSRESLSLADEQESSRSSVGSSSGSWIKFAVAAVAAGVVATAISVPLARRDNGSSASAQESPYTPPSYTPPFEDVEEGVPLLSKKVLNGYASTEEWMDAARLVAKDYVNGGVARNNGDMNYLSYGLSDVVMFRDDIMIADAPMAEAATPQSGVTNNVNDFETNNQESGVNEGDKVVTNGKVAFAAYGNYLVAWRVSDGVELIRMKLDPTGNVAPSINTLLLQGNHLILAVSGYGWDEQKQQTRVLSSYKATRILIYDIEDIDGESGASLSPIAQRDVNGNFVTIRAIDGMIHFVLSTELQFYELLGAPFERSSNPSLSSLDLEMYADQVRLTAEAENIPEFVQQLTDEIMECGQIPNLVAMNRWTTSEDSNSQLENFLYDKGVADSLVTIMSFNLTGVVADVVAGKTNALECLSVAGSFFPTNAWDVNVYSAKDTMLMAIKGYDYSTEREMSIDSTYMVAFDLTIPDVAPKSYGKVDGDVLDQYSFRVDGNILQLATTIKNQWMWIAVGMPMPMPLDRRLQEIGNIAPFPTTENYVITMDLEGASGEMEELDRIQLGKEGEVFTSVRFYKDLAYAVTFREMDPFYVLDTRNASDITIAGELDNITGWSSYLEPMNDENTIMLAIGEEANEWGQALGLSISVFDARDVDNVKISARFIIESETDVWSSSEGLRNKNAIRFNAETGRLIIPLILNSAGSEYHGFRVYIASVDSITEVEDCEVNLADYASSKGYLYKPNYLESRSMIIDGNFMSTMGDDIVSKDLGSCSFNWHLGL
eukprot:CAMPEP_0198155650 /NCGR_PEP_ID=MMETSP1443-20131203/69240_1 /TAXON_ID=186043 /ORGANISM="Entomoneis sp., Strain CCMP2396" /LENGTH=792 /DNA_ID=CAMNT_0043822407 /DNA_START=43 /DNA_END=2421 /DNA_ORIENTATION=+